MNGVGGIATVFRETREQLFLLYLTILGLDLAVLPSANAMNWVVRTATSVREISIQQYLLYLPIFLFGFVGFTTGTVLSSAE